MNNFYDELINFIDNANISESEKKDLVFFVNQSLNNISKFKNQIEDIKNNKNFIDAINDKINKFKRE